MPKNFCQLSLWEDHFEVSKLDSNVWKVCASLVKNAGNSGKNIINSDDNFYPSTEKNKEKLAKKRKIDSNKLQVNRTESIRIPCKSVAFL